MQNSERLCQGKLEGQLRFRGAGSEMPGKAFLMVQAMP